MTDLRLEGAAALAAIDRALAARPAKGGPYFTAATEHLCLMRDLLIAECRAGADRQAPLMRLNGIISSTLGAHFPLGAVPWPVVETAREALEALLAEVAA